MPKIRKKENFKVYLDNNQFEYKKKSGSLTRLPRNILKTKDSELDKIPLERSISSSGYPDLNEKFDDNKTIVFNQKTVDLITKTENTSSLENLKKQKLVAEPNEFTLSDFTSSFNTLPEYYDEVLEKSKFEINNTPFDENITFHENKTGEFKKDNEIVIDLDFSKDCFLVNNSTTGNFNDVINVGNDTHRPFKSPTAYFNFKSNRWDYLGDIEESSYSDPAVEKQNICFGGVSILKNTIIPAVNNNENKYPGSIGKPIDTYGFPYDVRYHGLEDHLINIDKYIDHDFVLKKVVFDGIFSSSGNGNADYGKFISLNNVSFFLLNQRENFNDNIISTEDLDELKKYSYISGSGSNTSLNTGTKEIKFKDEDGTTRKFSFLTDDSNGLVVKTLSGSETIVNNPAQRDLITYNNLVNYSSGSLDANNSTGINGFINYEKVKKEADFFKEISSDSDISNINYTRERITLSSNIKAPVKQDETAIFSDNAVIVGNKFGTRSGLNLLSGRSNKQENYLASSTNKFTINYTNVGDIDFNVYKDMNTEDYYVLRKGDKIILGVSLTNSLGFYNSDPGANDIFVIHDLKVKLIGSYEKRYKTKSTYSTEHMTSSSIKRSIIGNTAVVDSYITTPIQFLNNSYITREFDGHGIGSEFITDENDVHIINKSVTRSVKLLEDKNDIHDSATNNILKVIAVDNKKPLDDAWSGFDTYTNIDKTSHSGLLLHTKSMIENPTEYDNNIWANSYPFESKYSNLDKPILINYKRLGLKGFMELEAKTSTTVDTVKINFVDDIEKFFYSFNNNFDSRLPVNREIKGFKLGLHFYKRIKRFLVYNSNRFGHFCDKLNYNRDYASIDNEGKVEKLVIKKYINKNTYENITDVSLLQNTYNKNTGSEITKPFIDKDSSTLTQSNSIP